MHSCFSSRFRRGFVIAGLQLLVSTAPIGIAGGLWYQWRGDVEIRRAKAALEAAGYSTDPLSVCAPEVPKEGNFGNSELLRTICVDKKDFTPEMEEAHAALQALDFDKAAAASEELRRPRPAADQPTDWAAWRTWFRDGMEWYVPEHEQSDARAVLLTLQEQSQDVLPFLIEEAKNRKSSACVPSQRARVLEAIGNDAVSLSTNGPGSTVLFEMARFITLQTEAAAACGDGDQTSDLIRLQCALIELVRSERSFACLLIGVGFDELTMSSAWRAVRAGHFSEEQLRLLQEFFSGRESLKDAWTGATHAEIVASWYHSDSLIRKRFPFSRTLMTPPGMEGRGSWLDLALNRAVSRNFLALQARRFLSMKRQLDSGNPVAYWRQTQQGKRPMAALSGYLLPHLAIWEGYESGTSSLPTRVAWGYMKMGATQIACALERHRLAGGRIPEKLDELPAALLPRIPRDLDEKPLRYRPDGSGGWVIWSVGMDGTDDWKGNAPPAPAEGEEPRGAWREADWQWRMTRRPD